MGDLRGIWYGVRVVAAYELAQRLQSRRRLVTLAVLLALLIGVPFALARFLSPELPDEFEIDELAVGLSGSSAVFMFVAITLFASDVLNSVVADKSNRVIEVLLSSLRPYQLMAGKILGVGAYGLVSFSVLVGAVAISAGLIVPSSLGIRLTVDAGSAWILLLTIFWFVVGYFLFAALYAALGATVSRIEDVNQAVLPVTLVSVVVYLVAYMLVITPLGETGWGRALAMLPMLSQFAVPGLVLSGALSWPLALLAGAINVAALPPAIWFAGRVYSGSALAVGARVPLLRAWRGQIGPD
ncbi:MAG: ABC transporter permease [Chloroflexi bacterium]|nr:ABC transporter permease [Chloroflexota bacterium]